MKKIKMTLAAFLAIVVISSPVAVFAEKSGEKVLLGGCAFGVKLFDDSVYIAGIEEVDTDSGRLSPAGEAGLLRGDLILRANGVELRSASELSEIINGSGGEPVTLRVRRGESESDVTLTPVKSAVDGKYRAGLLVRDSSAGIGTITFAAPESLAFGGLGHGVGDPDSRSGDVKSGRGAVYGVKINSVVRGKSGTPGELQGTFLGDETGNVIENTPDGVFGLFTELPAELENAAELEICPRSEVKEGPAKLYCTLGDDGIGEYDVEISDVSEDEDAPRSFVVTVTDRRLIERTGGIVQGMSGSPIVQDGRLVGAVTHVLISDPKRGYGIFIEKMLERVPEVLR